MIRIAKTNFPSRIVLKGRVYYLNVPATVIERMGLQEGEYVDVRITLPETKKSKEKENQEKTAPFKKRPADS